MVKYKIFWDFAIPLLSVAMYFEWVRGIRFLVYTAFAASIVISYVWDFFWRRSEDAKARERERLALLCKHGNPRLKSCKSCAEEFAYWDVCKLCGYNWDTRREKHEHTIHVDNVSGRPTQFPAVMSYYSSGMSMMPGTFPSYQSSSQRSYLAHGAECKMTR